MTTSVMPKGVEHKGMPWRMSRYWYGSHGYHPPVSRSGGEYSTYPPEGVPWAAAVGLPEAISTAKTTKTKPVARWQTIEVTAVGNSGGGYPGNVEALRQARQGFAEERNDTDGSRITYIM